MEKEIYIVVKEYEMLLEGIPYAIKGRISKRINEVGTGDYCWSISHYCKPSKEAAGIYVPSRTHLDTEKEATRHLMMYMEPFTNIEVTQNDFY